MDKVTICACIDSLCGKGFNCANTPEGKMQREMLKQLQAKLDIATKALEFLLSDSQHINHDCGDSVENCPVLFARQALSKIKD